jgi:hypothetical protein
VPSTARLISRPDAAVLGLRVAVGDPALDELAGELLSHHSRPSDGCRAWKGKLNLDRRACLWREPLASGSPLQQAESEESSTATD